MFWLSVIVTVQREHMFEFEWPENLSIFFDNLCFYHIFFDLVSFLTIIFTWWYCTVANNTTAEKREQSADSIQNEVTKPNSNDSKESENLQNEEIHGGSTMLDWCDDSIMANVKFLRQKALMKELKSKLTEDELEEERKTEKIQLEKIFQLLQEQEDKFQMSSMKQVEDQLHLYIN